ncbi:mandelate racemase/muconate lactonizing enzyme family protein [Agrobacterium sp. ES01]|uniref:mandelate racemase/muconate lactonizing enzyme family protein n=1 Tax=Agrobacterium sp. ES01 TaxID=3420714 RepID=UPI003D143D7A
MRIDNITSSVHRLPPASPWEDATNKVDALEFVVVEITTDTGLKGTGFTYSVDIGGTAIHTLIEDYLSTLAIGEDPLSYEKLWSKLSNQSRRLGLGVNSMAIAAIDVAVWDIIGKHKNEPLHRLIGGARDSIPAYISEINLSENDRVEDLLARARDYLSRHYRAIKIKIGKPDFEADIERIAKLKEMLPSDVHLMVDLNQRWSASQAIQAASRLERFHLDWIEEPLIYHDVQGHADLKRSTKIPIALGESLYSKYQFLNYLRAGAVDIVQADVAFVGGVTEWLKIAHLAGTFGKPIAPHYMMELSLPLLCGVPNGFMLEDVVGGSLTELGLIENPIETSNGIGTPLDVPGHGIVFNRSALDACRTSSSELKASFRGGSK